MPKRKKHPKLRAHSWTTAKGEKRTAYYYDRRAEGLPDEPLGTDFAQALIRWHEIHFDKPRESGTIEEALKRWEAEKLPEYESKTTRRDYGLCLTQLRPVFGPARWDEVTFPTLKAYLNARTAKTRANRELSVLSIIWNWARGEGLTALEFPAAGMSRSRWKNAEGVREFEVTEALFAAVYEKADQVLRDCMDISSATGLRLTDCRTVALPRDGWLYFKASKTQKKARFEVTSSAVLTAILARRMTYPASHVMLMSTPTGRPVSSTMLRDRWEKYRDEAASDPKNEKIADGIKAMWLRDMRSRAADLAASLDDASAMLQHSSKRLTEKHYRTEVPKLKAVR